MEGPSEGVLPYGFENCLLKELQLVGDPSGPVRWRIHRRLDNAIHRLNRLLDAWWRFLSVLQNFLKLLKLNPELSGLQVYRIVLHRCVHLLHFAMDSFSEKFNRAVFSFLCNDNVNLG